jgi:hypothetical protein
MEKRIIARIATFLTVVCMSLAVSGATCPWLSYSGNPLIPPLTIGLFKYCEGTRCMDLKVDLAAVIAAGVNQPPISVSSVAAEWQAQGQVSAAMFFLAFIFLFFSSAAGVWVMMGKSSGKVKLLLTTFSAVLLFIGEVIAATWVRAGWRAARAPRGFAPRPPPPPHSQPPLFLPSLTPALFLFPGPRPTTFGRLATASSWPLTWRQSGP